MNNRGTTRRSTNEAKPLVQVHPLALGLALRKGRLVERQDSSTRDADTREFARSCNKHRGGRVGQAALDGEPKWIGP